MKIKLATVERIWYTSLLTISWWQNDIIGVINLNVSICNGYNHIYHQYSIKKRSEDKDFCFVIIFFLFWESFMLALTDGFPLGSERQQVSLSL